MSCLSLESISNNAVIEVWNKGLETLETLQIFQLWKSDTLALPKILS